jgi:DNA polymerase-3 subunit epsilon
MISQTPTIFFDLETTGSNPTTDRIVEIGAIKVFPNGERETKQLYINPTIEIPQSAIDVHGITNETVVTKPTFANVAKSMAAWFEGCDLAGYNLTRFDVPMLLTEFFRCGIMIKTGCIFDVFKIFTSKERRDLSAAVKFYLNEDHTGAHGALEDATATMRIFHRQLEIYPDIKVMTSEQLDSFSKDGMRYIDIACKIYLNNEGYPCYTFGKSKDQPIHKEPGFATWMLKNDFPDETKFHIRRILEDINKGIYNYIK